jgi:RHS repeat-associated protein
VPAPGSRYYPYGEESNPPANNADKFATYYRDGTGLDYADQRYYASTLGRFLTADPYKANAGASEPGSWNRYAYVENDPVNLTDAKGLEAEEATDRMVYCGEFGWVPQGACTVFVASIAQAGPITINSSGFVRTASNLAASITDLQLRQHFSERCRTGLAKVMNGLTPERVADAAYNIREIVDATTSNLTIAQAWGNTQAGRAAQFVANKDDAAARFLKERGRTDLTVSDYFEVHRGTSAYTPPGMGAIYLDARHLGGARQADKNQALVMHEILHSQWGLDDGDVLDSIYGEGSRNTRPSADITEWLRSNCARGKGND